MKCHLLRKTLTMVRRFGGSFAFPFACNITGLSWLTVGFIPRPYIVTGPGLQKGPSLDLTRPPALRESRKHHPEWFLSWKAHALPSR